MSLPEDFTSNFSEQDKAKMFDALIAKLIEGGNSDSIINDSITSLLNYKPFYPEKGKAYDGLFFRAAYGVKSY